MQFSGVLVGAFSFLVIGLFHPLVIRCEYYLSSRVWPAFLLLGLGAVAASVLVQSLLASCLLSVLGFSSLWSIGELKKQEERVKKGWFPANPRRKH